jgi:hypothetical protein
MKKLLLFIPLFLCSCSNIKWVTVDHGRIVMQNNEPVNIVGNPPMYCHYENSLQTFSGYFMYRKDDGTIILDDFGRGTIQLMDNPICKLGFNE